MWLKYTRIVAIMIVILRPMENLKYTKIMERILDMIGFREFTSNDVNIMTANELVLADLESYSKIYSDIVIKRIPACKVARYVIISINPEDDANNYMISWGKKSGLLSYYPDAMLIGYDFPFVSAEQKNRFNMRGYASAYFLPDTFETDCLGVEYIAQEEAEYAVITITDPFVQAFERIPKAYKYILEYFEKNNCKEKHRENVLDCFEHVYENDGITYMDVYMCKL